MTTYISTYNSELEDIGDCDDNFVKPPLSNKRGNRPMPRMQTAPHFVNGCTEFVWADGSETKSVDCGSFKS